jgi:hypothetical protein
LRFGLEFLRLAPRRLSRAGEVTDIIHEQNPLADKLDACTDCLDHGHGASCKEASDECPICDEVQMALLP